MTNGNQLNQSMNPSNFTKARFFVTRPTIQLKQRPIITAKPWDSDFPSRQIAPSFDTLGSVLSPLFAVNARSRLLKIEQYLCFYWKTESKPLRDKYTRCKFQSKRKCTQTQFEKVEAEPREKEFNKTGGWNIIRRHCWFLCFYAECEDAKAYRARNAWIKYPIGTRM